MLRCAEPVERKFLSDPSMDYHPVAVNPSRANVHRGARLRGHTRPGTRPWRRAHGGVPLRGQIGWVSELIEIAGGRGDGEVHEIKSADILQPGPAALTDGLKQLHGIVARWGARAA